MVLRAIDENVWIPLGETIEETDEDTMVLLLEDTVRELEGDGGAFTGFFRELASTKEVGKNSTVNLRALTIRPNWLAGPVV